MLRYSFIEMRMIFVIRNENKCRAICTLSIAKWQTFAVFGACCVAMQRRRLMNFSTMETLIENSVSSSSAVGWNLTVGFIITFSIETRAYAQTADRRCWRTRNISKDIKNEDHKLMAIQFIRLIRANLSVHMFDAANVVLTWPTTGESKFEHRCSIL